MLNVRPPNNLKMFRRRTGLSLEDVAFILDEAPISISRYENSLRYPSVPAQRLLAIVYDAPLDDLYTPLDVKLRKQAMERAIVLIEKYRAQPAMAKNLKRTETLSRITYPQDAEVPKSTRVLALDPSKQGIGFAVLESSPVLLVDWGVTLCKKKNKAHCLERVRLLIRKYRPRLVVVESYLARESRRPSITRAINRAILKLAGVKGIKTRTTTRSASQEYFAQHGASTKEQIAEFLSERFPELKSWLPKPPKDRFERIYKSEDYRMGIFDAVALGITAIRFPFHEGRRG